MDRFRNPIRFFTTSRELHPRAMRNFQRPIDPSSTTHVARQAEGRGKVETVVVASKDATRFVALMNSASTFLSELSCFSAPPARC